MSLSIITNPISGTVDIFAGFRPIEFTFKREDLAVNTVTSGTGGAKINHTGDLTSYLSEGDYIYLYSEGTNYTYDAVGQILTIVAGEITVDLPYIESGTGGYINYFKNYYVEMQCVHPEHDDINLLPFSLESDGDSAGNIIIDVSIMNDLLSQRGAIVEGLIEDSVVTFNVKYKQVYSGSSESFVTLDSKLFIVLYAINTPEKEVILNSFDMPKIYLGYPAAFAFAHEGGSSSIVLKMAYNEMGINKNIIASDTLGVIDNELNGFLLWEWDKDTVVQDNTKYIDLTVNSESEFDFRTPDFNYPDFVTQ